VAAIGLVLNTLFVWLFLTLTPLGEVWAKILAVPLVLGWNFFGRRLFVFYPKLPKVPGQIAARMVGITRPY